MLFNSKPLKTKNVLVENKKEKNKETKKVKKGDKMKYVNTKVLTMTAGLLTAFAANAAGTDAGTNITNNVSVAYDVGLIPQTPETANVSFLVDRNVVFTVTTAGNATVIPGSADQVLAYTLNHTGNYTGDFGLSAANNAGDDFDSTGVTVFVEDGTTVGYQALEDTETYVDELAEDGNATVYIVSDIPGAAVDNDVATLTLTAQAREGGVPATQGAVLTETGAADVAGTVENVFADAASAGSNATDLANDGEHSDDGDYNVDSAVVVVTKTSSIISDPVNGAGANRKRIPGAIIEYTITINNTGGASALNLAISDTLPAEMDYSPGTLFVGGAAEDDDAVNGGTSNPDIGDVTADVLSADIPSLAPAGSTTVVFRAVIL